MMRSGVFTDEVWAVIEPVLPSDVGRRGKRWSNHRMILEGIVWRYRVGAPWRDLPAHATLGSSCLLLTALWRNSSGTSIFASLLHDRPAMVSADGEVVASHSYTLCML